MKALDYLRVASDTMIKRGNERDKKNGERSMKAAVVAFNSLTGLNLSESQGWLFMSVLKISRSQGGRFIHDDFIDGAAYFALAGEAAEKENSAGQMPIEQELKSERSFIFPDEEPAFLADGSGPKDE